MNEHPFFCMSHQLTFADCAFNGKPPKTRKEILLARMDALIHCLSHSEGTTV